jgi:hypothetical protein
MSRLVLVLLLVGVLAVDIESETGLVSRSLNEVASLDPT